MICRSMSAMWESDLARGLMGETGGSRLMFCVGGLSCDWLRDKSCDWGGGTDIP